MPAHRHLDPFSGMLEHFDLAEKREQLAALPDIDGGWPKPASLSRMGWTAMDWKTLRRFEKKILPYDMGYDPCKGLCWLWTGGLHDKGYGRFYLGKDPHTEEKIWVYSHRIAFEHWIGLPKPGYIVDHQCNVKTCCNPAHLWPESNAENLRLADLRRPWKRRNQYSKE
jgi:hypothetical protein